MDTKTELSQTNHSSKVELRAGTGRVGCHEGNSESFGKVRVGDITAAAGEGPGDISNERAVRSHGLDNSSVCSLGSWSSRRVVAADGST